MPLGPHPVWRHAPPAHEGKEPFDIPLPARPGHGPHEFFAFSAKPAEQKTETLGRQFIEGVEAEGTRTISVIPAGQIGNERAIEIVSEKWYSPELQVNVMTRHADPRFGETVYRLRNVQRAEPDPSLFQVPSDYKIEEGPACDRIVIKKKKVD
jgi:hypothetical protein